MKENYSFEQGLYIKAFCSYGLRYYILIGLWYALCFIQDGLLHPIKYIREQREISRLAKNLGKHLLDNDHIRID